MEQDLISIIEELKKRMPKNRLNHTLGVMSTSVGLAMKNGVDEKKAAIAGLLHDVTKYKEISEQIKLLDDIGFDRNEHSSPAIYHAFTGAIVAKNDFGINDEDVLDAIRYHTTGRANMSKLEKIVFISDFIEPSRSFDKVEIFRYKAFNSDLDSILVEILESTIEYLGSKNTYIDELTIECLDFYRRI